jgi:hypothetical protein
MAFLEFLKNYRQPGVRAANEPDNPFICPLPVKLFSVLLSAIPKDVDELPLGADVPYLQSLLYQAHKQVESDFCQFLVSYAPKDLCARILSQIGRSQGSDPRRSKNTDNT